MTHAHLAETKSLQRIFALFHRGERFPRDRAPILDPGREARRRRFVPDAQSRLRRQLPNVCLGQSRCKQGRGHMMLSGSLLPWPEVALIVEGSRLPWPEVALIVEVHAVD